MKNAMKIISVAVIICAVCVFTPAKAQAKVLPKTAKLVPPETVLLVDVDNFSQLKGQFEKTSFYKLYKDPTMAAFVDDTRIKSRKKIKEKDNKIAETIVNADVLPQGRAAFALVLNKPAMKANKPIALSITQWGENASKVKEEVEKQVRKAVDDGLHKRSEDYRGVTIVTMIKELPPKKVPDLSNYNPENSNALPMKTIQLPPEKTSYCFVDDCLISSEDIEALKFVVAHIKGATSLTLADDADYNTAIAAVGPYHDIDFYVNIKQIIKTITAEDSTGKARTTIANLGFDNVAAFGCSIGLGRYPASSCCGKAFLKINGTKKGICKMLDIKSASLKAPRFIPTSAYSVTFLNLNIKKAHNELYNILYNFNPMYAAMMHAMDLPPSPAGEPGLQLKSDVIDHLGSQIITAQSIRKPFSTGSAPTESLVALAVNNRGALEKSMSLLHSKLMARNDPEARRELLGHTIYLIDFTALLPTILPGGRTPMQTPSGLGFPKLPAFAFTITDTHLIFGTESIVEQSIRRLSSTGVTSLGSVKWFNKAKSAIEPSIVGLAGLENGVASGELLWWMMKESRKAKSNNSSISVGVGTSSKSGMVPGLMLSQTGLFDPSLLPPFDAVRKYFGLFTFYGISRPDGFFFEFKYLNPLATTN